MQEISVLPGQVQGVLIILTTSDYQAALHTIINDWFGARSGVALVDHGTTDKQGLGYLMLEWTEQDVDQLFLDILRTGDWVHDYTVYVRDL